MKEWFKNIRFYLKNINFLAVFLPPLLGVCIMQTAYGAKAWQMSPWAIIGNRVCLGAVYYLLCAVTGRWVVSCIAVNLAAGLWGAANYFVLEFRGSPVMPWDLTALKTAAAVSSSYTFVPTRYMLAAAGVLAAAAVYFIRKKGTGHLGKTARIRAVIGCALCLMPVVQPRRLASFGIGTDVWDQAGAYRKGGALAVFLRNTEFLQVEKPRGLTPERVENLLASACDGQTRQEEKMPNIIAIMNESWADLEEYGSLELNRPVNGYISSLDNAVWGHTYTSVFGAGTSASEFEFLTGHSMAFLPSGSIPYQQYILDSSPSLAQLLKDKGYETLAFHPGEIDSWQRNTAYPLLGFDKFKCEDDMDVEKLYLHGYVSDYSDFDQIIWEFENRDSDKPLFIFNVTIQSHGSYTDESYPGTVYPTDCPGVYPKAEQYLSLVRETDEAFKKLVEYFSRQEEDTIIIMFGDHLPSIEPEFLNKAWGLDGEEMTMEEYMYKFRTPYVIWANFPLDIPRQEPADTSLNFLALDLLKYAGINGDEYHTFLDSFRQTVPALTFVGYTDSEGNAYSHLETNEYTRLIEDYQCVQYARLFGDDRAV